MMKAPRERDAARAASANETRTQVESIWAVDVDTGALQWVHRMMEGMRK